MMISTITLPVIQAAATSVKAAIQKMIAEKTSALVAVDANGPVVIDDQLLRNAQMVGGDDTPLSVVTNAAVPPPATRGFFNFRAKPEQTVLPNQPGFAVLDWNDKEATVKTDPDKAGWMKKPSRLFGTSGSGDSTA